MQRANLELRTLGGDDGFVKLNSSGDTVGPFAHVDYSGAAIPIQRLKGARVVVRPVPLGSARRDVLVATLLQVGRGKEGKSYNSCSRYQKPRHPLCSASVVCPDGSVTIRTGK